MHTSVLRFAKQAVKGLDHIGYFEKGPTVLEIGSYDVNGSVKKYFTDCGAQYTGVDISPGPKVDLVVAEDEDLVQRFGENSFDIVVCCEMLEHAKDWRGAITAIKQIARDYAFVTTRGPGFPYHPFPADYWRYTVEDFDKIFSDMNIVALRPDPEWPGVMMLAMKPDNFEELNLGNYKLASVKRRKGIVA